MRKAKIQADKGRHREGDCLAYSGSLSNLSLKHRQSPCMKVPCCPRRQAAVLSILPYS